jgi:hypothetical protein
MFAAVWGLESHNLSYFWWLFAALSFGFYGLAMLVAGPVKLGVWA